MLASQKNKKFIYIINDKGVKRPAKAGFLAFSFIYDKEGDIL